MCTKEGSACGQDTRDTKGVQKVQYAPASPECFLTPKFQGIPERLFEWLRRERETGQIAWLTCGKGGEMFWYLCEVARCEKTPPKSTFWAAKPTKKSQKEEGEGAEEVNGGGRHSLLPSGRCKIVGGDRVKSGDVTTG